MTPAQVAEMNRLSDDLRRASESERAEHRRVVALVQQLRSAGASWGYVGALLGVSRQAARQRFADAELVHG